MFETRSIGIDIRRNAIRIAIASAHAGQTRILDLIEKQIPEASPEELRKLSAAIIREAFVENDLNGDTCVVSLPVNISINRTLTSPITDMGKIRQTLKFQMEPQIPYPVDQVVSDFIPLQRTSEGAELLAMAVTKEAVAERLDILKDAGIDPQIITLDALALADFYINPFDFSGDKVTVFLCLHHDYCFLGFFKGSKIMGYRNFAGMRLADELTDQKMVKEIQRSLLSYQAAENSSGEIGSICIAGLNADKLKLVLQERFPDVPVKTMEFNENAVADIPPHLLNSAQECHLAIALAHTGLGNSNNGVNFRRDEYAPASLLSRLKPNIYFSLSVLLIAFIAWFVGVATSNHYQARQLKVLNQEMMKSFTGALPGVKSPGDVQQKIREEQEKFKLLKSYSSEYVAPLDVLAEVTANIPSGKAITLSDLAISDSTLRMTGEADSFDDINLFRDNLDSSSFLAEVKIESANKADKSNKIGFRIKANVGRQVSNQPAASSGKNI